MKNEINYFSAKEAREVTNAIKGNIVKDELDFIYEKINDARFKGYDKITISNKSFCKGTIDFLKSKGFKVEHFSGCQCDPADDTTISW